MGCVRKTTKREVLQRALTLLEQSNARYQNRVFVMAGQSLPVNIKDYDLLTVSITHGTYSYGEQVGGGEHVVPYQGTLSVSLWHTCRTDRQGTDHELLLNGTDGMFKLQNDILISLLGSLLPGTGETYDPILTQCIYAISDTESTRTQDGIFGRTPSGDTAQAVMTIEFGVDFMLDIASEP